MRKFLKDEMKIIWFLKHTLENIQFGCLTKKPLKVKSYASRKDLKLPIEIHQSEVTCGWNGNFISCLDAVDLKRIFRFLDICLHEQLWYLER